MTPRQGATAGGRTRADRPGPMSDGPRTMTATTSPITGGWPTRANARDRRSPVTITAASASRTWTRIPVAGGAPSMPMALPARRGARRVDEGGDQRMRPSLQPPALGLEEGPHIERMPLQLGGADLAATVPAAGPERSGVEVVGVLRA